MPRFIDVKTHAPSGTIVLRRPDKRNALNRQMIEECKEALFDLHQERNVRAVILTGEGSSFCAGMDLSEMHDVHRQEEPPLEQWHHDTTQYKELIDSMLQFPKPIIAAVNGPAVAGGAGLVLASDITVGTEGAVFGLPEPRRGIVAGMVAPLITFRVGAGHAANLLLSARLIEAEEACRISIYHELVQSDLLWARAHELAGHCAESAPESLQMTKRMLNETIGEQLNTLLTAGAAASATSRTTEAAAEGVAAFLQKRPPKWSS